MGNLQRQNQSLEAKKNLVGELIAAGVTVNDALLRAGYSPTNTKPGQCVRKLYHEVITSAREKFAKKYLHVTKKSLSGEYVGNRLSEIARKDSNAKEDFNAIQALKLHFNVMLPRSEKHNSVLMQGIFCLPSQASPSQEWKSQALQLQAETPQNNVTQTLQNGEMANE